MIARIQLLPTDAQSCARMLAEAAAARRTVRVRGGGTKDYLGELLPTDGALETTALAGVVAHVPADLTVTVRAGTPLAELQRVLAAAGQMLPVDPPHAGTATVGGIIAANSNGFGRLRYGGLRDLLIGSTTALADGTLARSGGRVVKNVAGYDLNKLLIGSLGTLGVLVEATFKVVPVATATGAGMATCSRGEAFAIAASLLRTPARPSALVVEGRREGGWRVVVAGAGTAAEVERVLREAAREATARGRRFEPSPQAATLLEQLRELPASATEGVLVRAALPIAAQAPFADTVTATDGFTRLVADAASGTVRVHLRGDDDAMLAGATALLGAARVCAGSARVERREARLRGRLGAWAQTEPPGHFLMKRLKEAFDPAGVLEPGRSPV